MTTTGPEPARSRAERFRGWYDSTYDDVLRFVHRRCHPSHAEDVVADAFLVAWRRYAEVPADHGESRAWLFGIARGCLANARRGDQRREALRVRIADARPPGVTLDAEDVAHRVDLAAAWRRLRPVDQEALALTAWDGLTGPQAAAVLGVTPTAYRLRLSRARRALRRHLDATPATADRVAITRPATGATS
ncbi:RNA polymerase sigma factor [Ornithinimicrobium sediminis]|uniref:RNA polymerase sigma factor n=1 Tax=Ornithinimicrobium sediminis TaxID=2904603 RepID=UPI001E2944B0|nr:sigma-70 family RNA polymerase sigma factor [Ornithinimicrobium sediminis]MCE0486051.1 sigma-70 family RNA polymerase sigma factor [Ornithinimicrobium sediminis]